MHGRRSVFPEGDFPRGEAALLGDLAGDFSLDFPRLPLPLPFEARRVWEKIRADVQAVADQSQILQSSIGSSAKGTDAALLGSTASTNRDLTGVTTTTASPVRSSV